MANNKNKTKKTQATLAAQLAAGTSKRFPAGSMLTVGGATITLVQIETELNGFASLRKDVETARAALEAALAAETAQATAMNAFIDAFVKIVRGAFGNQPDALADFGLTPEATRTPLTVEQKATAVAKRAATRSARGTKGPKAKLAITGNVTAVTVTPVTAATAAAPAVTAAVTAAVGTNGSTGATSATAAATSHS